MILDVVVVIYQCKYNNLMKKMCFLNVLTFSHLNIYGEKYRK